MVSYYRVSAALLASILLISVYIQNIDTLSALKSIIIFCMISISFLVLCIMLINTKKRSQKTSDKYTYQIVSNILVAILLTNILFQTENPLSSFKSITLISIIVIDISYIVFLIFKKLKMIRKTENDQSEI